MADLAQTFISCLEALDELGYVTPRESDFYKGLAEFRRHQGRLTDKQFESLRKMTVRIITEREVGA